MYSRKSDRREDFVPVIIAFYGAFSIFVMSNNPVKHCDGTPSGSRAAGYSHVTYLPVHKET
jgi:hypothetical protein